LAQALGHGGLTKVLISNQLFPYGACSTRRIYLPV